jgi:hypothetical protein
MAIFHIQFTYAELMRHMQSPASVRVCCISQPTLATALFSYLEKIK